MARCVCGLVSVPCQSGEACLFTFDLQKWILYSCLFLLLVYPDLVSPQVLHFVHGMLVGLPSQSYIWKVNWCPERFSYFWSLTCFLSLSARVISAFSCLHFTGQQAGVSSRYITRGFLFSLPSNMFSSEHTFLMITRHPKACLPFLIADKVFSW